MTDRERLLRDIEDFLTRVGMAPSMLGKLAANDTALVGRLRAGSDIRMGSAERLRRFMSEYARKPACRTCDAA